MSQTANDIPMFSLSNPDLTPAEKSAFPSAYDRAPVAHTHPLEPLAVASCPPSPTKRRTPFLPIPQLRTLIKKLKPKSQRARAPFPPRLALPSHRVAFSTTRPIRHRRLGIRDPVFFLPTRQAVNVYEDEAGIEDAENSHGAVVSGCCPPPPTPLDASAESGFQAPPPIPLEPFLTAPQTPLLEALSAIGNSSVALRRAAQEKKIVQVFGPEAEEAARQHVEQGSVRAW
ncbi:hypothetical protein B0H17DRAFT_1328936 [Mycena rosella]|uniref:Uncharacterized protein n=1 Tax=Mycena rosella TaxID=1033263 RepID=A0AAD7DR63_MYCRO|nr:hypothetical protein B0H17DRAFT_1328936 [Mycena rosella]